ncbi:glyoxalase/bleomycin resistance protein/dioxygenase [Luminiphilus syltensis NOR5-1B]|uniref:Glyoxalase/bleomycin resistance protein/dioxygenase n=1 Tax=Luminiphilus syltensis NOR5-1B TaxID=565045 RepID=B8KV39_9GAMM|nr:VOC family protein [Luminiphilus syltensis]EED35892.1 glyoxalase/bleomycin resistance protein/dioxygenase [Luminiphilus syltensis NOR5-1B]
MFSHIMVGTNDMQASKAFYDAILGVLGYGEGTLDDKGRCFYMSDNGFFAITPPIDGNPATAGNGCTIGFSVENGEQADAWHKAGVENGGTAVEDPPGIRDNGAMKLYLAYLRDPAGNKLCAVKFL